MITEGLLTAEDINAIKSEFASLHGPARQMLQGDTATQRILLDTKTVENCPSIKALLKNKILQARLKYGAAKNHPSLIYVQRIRHGHNASIKEQNSDPQKTIHSDTFHPAMKAWLFLEDVTPDKGPFHYVRGSCQLTVARIKWEYKRSINATIEPDGYSEKGSLRASPTDLLAMGLPAPEPMCVKAGTLVVGNTHGFHGRGFAKASASRLELWAYGRYNPFNPLPGFGLSVMDKIQNAALQRFWQYKDKIATQRQSRASWHIIDKEQMFDDLP